MPAQKRIDAVGESHPAAKLTDDDIRHIRILIGGGMLLRTIADKFDVSLPTIKKISCRETWTHVT